MASKTPWHAHRCLNYQNFWKQQNEKGELSEFGVYCKFVIFANNRCQLSVSMSTSSQSDYNRNYKYNCNEYSYKSYNLKSYNTIQHSATCCIYALPHLWTLQRCTKVDGKISNSDLAKQLMQLAGEVFVCFNFGEPTLYDLKGKMSGGKMERLRAKRRCFSFCDLNRARKLFRSFHQTGLAHRVVSFGHVGSDAYEFFRVGLPRLP